MTDPEETRREAWATIPNAICVARGIGAIGLLPTAVLWGGQAVLVLFLVLAASDLIDGKLARFLDQRSTLGPRLDSVADAAMYVFLGLSILYLRLDVLANEIGWIALALLLYVISFGYSLIKFRRMPSYHLRTAKAGFFFTAAAVVSVLLGGPSWPVRLAMFVVGLANLEGIVMTWWLNEPRSDVRSVVEAGVFGNRATKNRGLHDDEG